MQFQHRLRSLSILGVALLCALYCRLSIVPRPSTAFSAADNPTAHEPSWWTRTLSYLYLPVANFQLLLWPQHLSFDWGMEAIPRIRTLWDARNVLSLAFYGILLAVTCKGVRWRCTASSSVDYAAVATSISLPLLQRLGGSSCQAWHGLVCACHHQLKQQQQQQQRSSLQHKASVSRSICSTSSPSTSVLVTCIAFMVLPFLPACNLFFHVGFVLAERLLYLPSVGYCLMLGLGFGRLWQRLHSSVPRLLLLCCLGLLLGAFSLRTIQRNRDWQNEEQLFRSAIAINPPKGKS